MKSDKPRFVKGKLVMLSRKNTRSGNISYFDTDPKNGQGSYQRAAGYLERGIPIFLTEDPEKLDRTKIKDGPWELRRLRDNFIWKITFLKDEKLYVMYMAQRQYNHELVKAVPRRLTKDYSRENPKVRT